MSFRLPNRVPSKRASSFHFKKLAPALQNYTEDTEHLLNRNKASTPSTTKSNRVSCKLDLNISPKSNSKSALHQQLFETPKSKILENKNLSIADSRIMYLNELHEKISPLPKPQLSRPVDEFRKIEEKHLIKIYELKKENDLLRMQLEKNKNRKEYEVKRIKTWKDLKVSTATYRQALEEFVIKVKEDLEKLIALFSKESSQITEAYQVLETFNLQLKSLSPFLGLDTIKKYSFIQTELEMCQNTGRFKSLSDTQHSFASNFNQAVSLKEVIALSDFHANHHGELSFHGGDRIQLIKTDDPYWWLGKLDDKIGRIPAQLVMPD